MAGSNLMTSIKLKGLGVIYPLATLYTILNTTNLTLLLYDASVSIGTVTTVPVAYLMRAVAYWRVAVRVSEHFPM